MLGNILFIGGTRADSKLLQNILRGGEGALASATVARAINPQEVEQGLTQDKPPFLAIIDTRIDWAQWQDLVPQLTDAAIPTILFGVDPGLDTDEALSLGVMGLFPGDSGGLLGISQLASTYKVSAAAQQEENLHHTASQRTECDRAQDKVFYAISHDFQAPLQLSHRYAQILEEDYQASLDDEGRKLINHLISNLGAAQEMLDELLDYSRLQTYELRPEPVDLEQLLLSTLELFQLDLDAASAQVSADTLPVHRVDRRQFQHLFQNLIANAIKFQREKPLRISVRYKETASKWGMSFRDNGIGIKDPDPNKMLEMFKRGQTDKEYPGHGMGLAICKKIIQNHGGHIWIKSVPGKGTSINFALPLSNDE